MSKPKALVVDDDRAIVLGVQMRLKHAGYEVIAAHDGAEGLAKIRSENPDLVLLDVRMPGMDGLSVLREIRRDEGQVSAPAVIMLSASLQDQETALEAGAQFFLRKPYRSSDLLEAVASVACQTD